MPSPRTATDGGILVGIRNYQDPLEELNALVDKKYNIPRSQKKVAPKSQSPLTLQVNANQTASSSKADTGGSQFVRAEAQGVRSPANPLGLASPSAQMATVLPGSTKMVTKEPRHDGVAGSTAATTGGRKAFHDYPPPPPPPPRPSNNTNNNNPAPIFKPFSLSMFAPPQRDPSLTTTASSSNQRTNGRQQQQQQQRQQPAPVTMTQTQKKVPPKAPVPVAAVQNPRQTGNRLEQKAPPTTTATTMMQKQSQTGKGPEQKAPVSVATVQKPGKGPEPNAATTITTAIMQRQRQAVKVAEQKAPISVAAVQKPRQTAPAVAATAATTTAAIAATVVQKPQQTTNQARPQQQQQQQRIWNGNGWSEPVEDAANVRKEDVRLAFRHIMRS